MNRAGKFVFIIGVFGLCVALFTFLRPEAVFPDQTFVNDSDATLKLDLKVNPLHLNSVVPRVAGALSRGRLLGKQAGLYTLKNEQGISTGEYVWMKGPACCGPATAQTLLFWPREGDRWSVAVEADGSFQDSRGATWRLKRQ
jgi:hypothetical protein